MKEKIAILCSLVLLEGIPYGFQLQVLPLLLRQKGFNLWKITLLNVLNLPWLLKSLLVPLLSTNPKHRTKLMIGCLSLIGLCLGSIDMLVNSENILLLSLSLAICNVCVVVLDVMADGYAMSMVKEEIVGTLSTIRVVAYKLGMLSTSLGLVYTSDLSNIIMPLPLVYFAVAAIIYVLPNESLEEEKNQSDKSVSSHSRTLREMLSDTFTCLQEVPGSYVILTFCVLHKLGERGFLSILPIVLLDNGLNISQISVINGVVGQFFSIFGSSLGGIYAHRTSTYTLPLAILIRLTCMCFQLGYTVMVTDVNVVIYGTSEIILQITIGFITTIAFTKIMLHSMQANGAKQATNYSILSSMIPFGKIFISTISGSLADMIGSEMFLFMCCCLEIILVLFIIAKKI